MTKELLANIPIFKSLPESELEHLAATLSVHHYASNELILREGEAGDRFYIIISGQVEAIKAMGTEDERVLGVRGPGQFIGELSLIQRQRVRTATIRAIEPVSLWEMTHSEFDALLVRQPTLSYELVRVLADRLLESENATINDLREKNSRLAEMYAALQAAQAQIIEKEKLDHELQVAYQIQVSILPRSLPQIEGYDFAARMLPARVVGGDFYDIFRVDGDRIGIMIGDVADKGMPSAIYMARTHALLYAELNRNPSPVSVLKQVNRYLMQMSNAPLFVTVLLGILDIRTGELHYARGGHELPILACRDRPIERFPFEQGQILGILDEPVIDEQRVTIPSNATVLLYTDGVMDERNPQGNSFGLEGLMASLSACHTKPAFEICEQLLQNISAHQQGMQQDDDITMLVIKRGEKLSGSSKRPG